MKFNFGLALVFFYGDSATYNVHYRYIQYIHPHYCDCNGVDILIICRGFWYSSFYEGGKKRPTKLLPRQ